MKNSPYSPDKFMEGLYEKVYKDPYENVKTKEDVFEVNSKIRSRAKEIFSLEKIPKVTDYVLEKAGEDVDFGTYTLKKYSVEISKGLKMLVYIS